MQGSKAIQGNLDPATLYGSPESIRSEVKLMLDGAYAGGDKTGYIANLGHGITQFTPPENLQALLETVRNYSVQYHQD